MAEADDLVNAMRKLLSALDDLLAEPPTFVTPADLAAMRRLRANVSAALAGWDASA